MKTAYQIRALINRLARLDASETWETDLNPAQIAALDYLARANRFSRAPSHVADFLGTTRGTMSQTLKALERKGFVKERRSTTDRRSISYETTETGHDAAARRNALTDAIDTLTDDQKAALQAGLSTVLKARLSAQGGRAFGLCHTCAHHRVRTDGAFCALLSVKLLPHETTQICHEHETL